MAKKQTGKSRASRPPVEKTEVVYAVAASLDGFIADSGGGVDWLHAAMVRGEGYGLAEFTASIDAILMGSGTYQKSLELGGGYRSRTPCWVFSSRTLTGKGLTITAEDPRSVVSALPGLGIRRAWLMGGGKLASSFLIAGLIDEISVAVMPVVLGSGIPLFAGGIPATHLELIEKTDFKGGSFGLRFKPKWSTVGSRQSTVGSPSRQSAVASRQSPVGSRQSLVPSR
jgi:dihydrofolate reductase